MAKESDTLGDLMKSYEMSMAGVKVMKGIPLLARLDGRSFHSFTKGLTRPYDERLSTCMIETTKYLVEETHANVGYTQSDEISLAWFIPADSTADYMFDGRVQKLTSILAGLASAKFLRLVMEKIPEKADKIPVFDCRVWQVPTIDLAAQAFLWRELDATKNSISMAAHAYFSHKSLQGLNGSEKQERLWAEKGINWNDYPTFFKRGTYVQRKTFERELTEAERMAIPEKHRPEPGQKFTRSSIVELELPPAKRVANYADVLFFKEEPKTRPAGRPNGETILELN
jgi:tRNA(His) 5'-end guanylyltransferase